MIAYIESTINICYHYDNTKNISFILILDIFLKNTKEYLIIKNMFKNPVLF